MAVWFAALDRSATNIPTTIATANRLARCVRIVIGVVPRRVECCIDTVFLSINMDSNGSNQAANSRCGQATIPSAQWQRGKEAMRLTSIARGKESRGSAKALRSNGHNHWQGKTRVILPVADKE